MSQAIILLFDVTNMESFEHTLFWQNSITKLAQKKPEFFLVANKIDESKKRVVSKKLAYQVAKKCKMHYHEISIKTNKGIKDLVAKVALVVMEKGGEGKAQIHRHSETYIQHKACIGCTIMWFDQDV